MSPRGSKCTRVSKVAAKGRAVRGHYHRVTLEVDAVEASTTGTSSSDRAAGGTMTTDTKATATTTATTRTNKSAVAACEGRSSWATRMRQPLETGLEPRENGTAVQRWPTKQRRHDRILAAKRNRLTDVGQGDAISSSTSLSSPALSSASSTDVSLRRSVSPPSTVPSPACSTSSTSTSTTSQEKLPKGSVRSGGERRPADSGRCGNEQERIRKRRQERQCSIRSRGGKDPATEEPSAVTATTPSTSVPVSSTQSSPSPFSSSVSTLSETVKEQPGRSSGRGYPAVPQPSSVESLRNALESYDRSRIYLAHVTFLDWRDLPGRRRATTATAGDAGKVWVVGAADHEGHHRTRLLVTGRHWRPRCLRRVNMLSQPVIYAGGGRGSLTVDLFLWWFHREFAVTAMAMHPDGAVLIAESADYLPAEADCVAADGLVRLFVIPKDYLEMRIVVREFRLRLATGILSRAGYSVYRKLVDPLAPTDPLSAYMKKFTLKEAFADLHRAWLSVRSETFARSWIVSRDLEDVPATGLGNTLTLSRRIHASADQDDDKLLLVELQNLAREMGLEVSDEELSSWILEEENELVACVKKELEEDHCNVKIEAEGKWTDYESEGEELEEEEDQPTAEETVGLLSRVLTWMEREPLDPALLLAVRSMRDTAALMASKMGLAGTHPSGLPFFCPNGDHLTQPPPAHMGIPPYGTLDAGKAAAAAGLTRAPMYPFSTGQYPYPMLSPEMTQVAASWHTPSMYPISPASAGFRSPYPTSLPITSSSLPSDLYRFSPTGLMPPHPGLSPHAHALTSHALVPSTPKTDHSSLDHNHRSSVDQKNSASLVAPDSGKNVDSQQNNQDKKKPHIKKPLNAFMLYMKEMRAKVVAECTLKESAAINQILGRRWHSLSREEQARYYEAARQERHLHQQRYPGWSARDNYGYGSKKKKRKKERSADPTGGNNMKKCRARYGLDQQSQWCKPCRRKKKCIRYMGEGGDGDGEADGEGDDDHSEDNLGSVGEAGTPEDDESLSSPGGLSALSSLASPSLVLPSPSSLASPCPCPLTPPVPPPLLSNATSQPVQPPPPHRNPVGTNPHDINNPLSVNQLTGQCIKSEVVPAPSGTSNPAISVT